MENLETIQPTVTLDEITEMYLDQHMMPEGKYRRMYTIGIRALRLFHRDSTGAPQTVNLTILANNTAVLPVGALNKISVGVLNNRGEIAPLTYDPSLSLYDSTNPQRLERPHQDLLINNEQFIVESQELQGGLVPLLGYGQLGVGSQPNIGFYNIDWGARVMVFNFGKFCYNTVQFKYLGLPCCENGDYFVHPFFQEALIAYLDWQDSKGDKRVSSKTAAIKKRDFDIEYNNARRAMEPFDLSDQYNQWRASLRMSVKV